MFLPRPSPAQPRIRRRVDRPPAADAPALARSGTFW